ncbi:MAG: hypothetical protein A4E28_02205 [Methanocella sp. PtaU1.Bin125]|nr:MAG: hypothetical protein A4E28_02205 [Methanocella sp. PtaU1.Bin125]
MKIFRYWRSSSSALVRWMPAFSISSRRMIGAFPMTTASAISNDRVWPPESPVILQSRSIGSPVSWLANSSVSCTSEAGSPLLRMVAWVQRNSRTGRSERKFVCWEMSAIGFFDGSHSTSPERGAPSMSTRRPEGVSPSANSSMSLISVVLPHPVGPTMLTTSPIRNSTLSTGSGRPSFPRPPMTVIFLMSIARLISVHLFLLKGRLSQTK